MAALSLSASSRHGSVRSLQTGLMRLATAIAAVVGIAAMATQGSAGEYPSLVEGTYLYGESPVAETLGATYLVFQVTDNQLAGAIYQPSSSFDCVHGTVTADALNLVVVDAYDQTESIYAVALVPGETTVASASGLPQTPQLKGLHPIQQLSTLDHQLLAVCAQP